MMEIGKLQPQAVDLEEAVLGAMLLEKEAILACADILSVESFYKENNGRIYRAIRRIYDRSEPVDILTVTQELQRTNELKIVGGSYAVSVLTNRMASSVNTDFHARIVQQKFLQREMIRISNTILNEAYNDNTDAFELMEKSVSEVEKLIDGIHNNKISSIGEIKDKVIEQIETVIDTGTSPGIQTSIEAFNKQLGGWQKTDLIILAARPGMGKTAAAVDFALNPALKGIPTGFFSLEMSAIQLAGRVLSSISHINGQKILNKQINHLDLNLLKSEGKLLDTVPFFIDDTPALSIIELRTRARKMKREKKIELLVIDYLQLMKGASKNGNRESEISEISRGLKALAKELDIPIIALSQLSRECEKRADKKPQLADLRESGAIEQDADIVLFMLRPEYYGQEKYQIGKNEYDAHQLLIFILAKFRNGSLGEIKARWIGELYKIDNYKKDESF